MTRKTTKNDPTPTDGRSPIAAARAHLDAVTDDAALYLEALSRKHATAMAALDETITSERAKLGADVEAAKEAVAMREADLEKARADETRTAEVLALASDHSTIAAGGTGALRARDAAEIDAAKARVAREQAERDLGAARDALREARAAQPSDVPDPALPSTLASMRFAAVGSALDAAAAALKASTRGALADAERDGSRFSEWRAQGKALRVRLAEHTARGAAFADPAQARRARVIDELLDRIDAAPEAQRNVLEQDASSTLQALCASANVMVCWPDRIREQLEALANGTYDRLVDERRSELAAAEQARRDYQAEAEASLVRRTRYAELHRRHANVVRMIDELRADALRGVNVTISTPMRRETLPALEAELPQIAAQLEAIRTEMQASWRDAEWLADAEKHPTRAPTDAFAGGWASSRSAL